ncbi:MAG: hypothetical protein WC433_06525 [Candidatus Omnitrophota bacterium]
MKKILFLVILYSQVCFSAGRIVANRTTDSIATGNDPQLIKLSNIGDFALCWDWSGGSYFTTGYFIFSSLNVIFPYFSSSPIKFSNQPYAYTSICQTIPTAYNYFALTNDSFSSDTAWLKTYYYEDTSASDSVLLGTKSDEAKILYMSGENYVVVSLDDHVNGSYMVAKSFTIDSDNGYDISSTYIDSSSYLPGTGGFVYYLSVAKVSDSIFVASAPLYNPAGGYSRHVYLTSWKIQASGNTYCVQGKDVTNSDYDLNYVYYDSFSGHVKVAVFDYGYSYFEVFDYTIGSDGALSGGTSKIIQTPWANSGSAWYRGSIARVDNDSTFVSFWPIDVQNPATGLDDLYSETFTLGATSYNNPVDTVYYIGGTSRETDASNSIVFDGMGEATTAPAHVIAHADSSGKLRLSYVIIDTSTIWNHTYMGVSNFSKALGAKHELIKALGGIYSD